MKLIDKLITCKSRSDVFWLYALGDVHLGARNCAETQFKRLVAKIAETPNALWIGGGDLCDCIKPQDFRRYGADMLPNWMLEGDADSTRDMLRDICLQEGKRLVDILWPIKDKCLGLIEGNHEYDIRRYYNSDHHRQTCDYLDVEDLTSESFIRLRFQRQASCRTIMIFATHGFGGGRTAGAEPNHLQRLAANFKAEIIIRGHSHTFCILPPIVELGIPFTGELPDECENFYKRAANWGCWLKSYAVGPSSYDSRACYPARPLSTLEIELRPHIHNSPDKVISMRELVV